MDYITFDSAGWKCRPECRSPECAECTAARERHVQQLRIAAERRQITVKVQPQKPGSNLHMRNRSLSLYLYSADWPDCNAPAKNYVYKDKKHFYIDDYFIGKVLQRRFLGNPDDVILFFERIGVPRQVVDELDTQVKEKLFGVISIDPAKQGLVDEALHFDFPLDEQVKRSGGPYQLLYPDPEFDFNRTAAADKLPDGLAGRVVEEVRQRGRLPAGIQPVEQRKRFDLLGGHLKFSELLLEDGVWVCLFRESFEELGLTTDRNIDRSGLVVREPVEVTSDEFERAKEESNNPRNKMFVVFKRIPDSDEFFVITVTFVGRDQYIEAQLEAQRSVSDSLPEGLRVVLPTESSAADDGLAALTERIAAVSISSLPPPPPDLTIKCKVCAKDFVFTAAEQEFFRSKDYKPPVTCKACKAEQKRGGGGGRGERRGDGGNWRGRGGSDRAGGRVATKRG